MMHYDLASLAERLDGAAHDATATPQLEEALTLEQAYAIQRLSVQRRLQRGERRIGRLRDDRLRRVRLAGGPRPGGQALDLGIGHEGRVRPHRGAVERKPLDERERAAVRELLDAVAVDEAEDEDVKVFQVPHGVNAASGWTGPPGTAAS